jgi:E3 ubiquitin-protein ligase RNF14
MSSGASSSSSPPPAESGDGYWEAREEAAARLEAMAARARGEDELSAEQLETNNRLQEDEVNLSPALPTFEFTRRLGALAGALP